jgi:hypothetical protein
MPSWSTLNDELERAKEALRRHTATHHLHDPEWWQEGQALQAAVARAATALREAWNEEVATQPD